MKRERNIELNENSITIRRISFSITLIIMATILCSSALMHIIIN